MNGQEDADAARRARVILEQAGTSQARLDFILAVSHELRTPAGVIAGYASLARMGEVSAEEAIDVVDLKIQELLALLEVLLLGADAALDEKQAWDERLRQAMSNSERLRGELRATHLRARQLIERRGGVPEGVPTPRTGERRDLRARAVRDLLAQRTGVQPRDLGTLPHDVARRLLDRIPETPEIAS